MQKLIVKVLFKFIVRVISMFIYKLFFSKLNKPQTTNNIIYNLLTMLQSIILIF